MLPIWLLVFWPSYLWLILIPLNYLIDRIVLKWSLKDMPEKDAFCRRYNWNICLAGFLADFAGMAVLLAVFMLTGTLVKDSSPIRGIIDNLEYGIGFNPFYNIFSFIVVAISVAVSALCIYLLDKKILEKAGLDSEQAKCSALKLALITAPYLYFFPSGIIYDSHWFYM